MKKVMILICTLFSLTSYADKKGVWGELNFSEFNSDAKNYNHDFGLGAGFSYYNYLSSDISFRTGAGIVQRKSETSDGKSNISLVYLEVPLTMMIDFKKDFSLFGGLTLNVKLSDDINHGGAVAGTNSLVANIIGGGQYRFGKEFALEGIIEVGLSNIYQNTRIGNTLSGRFLYFF